MSFFSNLKKAFSGTNTQQDSSPVQQEPEKTKEPISAENLQRLEAFFDLKDMNEARRIISQVMEDQDLEFLHQLNIPACDVLANILHEVTKQQHKREDILNALHESQVNPNPTLYPSVAKISMTHGDKPIVHLSAMVYKAHHTLLKTFLLGKALGDLKEHIHNAQF
jgi:hypothetical protein